MVETKQEGRKCCIRSWRLPDSNLLPDELKDTTVVLMKDIHDFNKLLESERSRHEKELKKYRDAIIVLYGSEGIMLFEKMSLKDWIREMTIGYKSVKRVFGEKKSKL
jgi:hypothetical protein